MPNDKPILYAKDQDQADQFKRLYPEVDIIIQPKPKKKEKKTNEPL